ncbi:helix-turn-helix domain-containing protein [Pseudomarimonas arenosa]|uniref:Helix-turn-helix domain-containing protein n=1 Tax=Pseudomarimonas arenosa TaxID=2774145 RepID=A0AAW3ZNZ4_9GAMM|nr:helix-turn-helix domain-containing protein [Pseudomarimonas arenosa]MBD8526899.1 helix-turn-helix domain-containing protein [Pseudomarimonas arenosa]
MDRSAVIASPAQLATVLRDRRDTCKLTQKQVAALVGLLPKTISAMESDPGRSSVTSLFKLLSALDIELVLQPKPKTSATSKTEW